jgi:hypothetical protein
VGLERGPLSLVSTTEQLFERNSSGSGLEIREYGRRDPSRWQRGTLYPQKKLALSSPTSGGRSVGIVRSRIQATEFLFFTSTPLRLHVLVFVKSILRVILTPAFAFRETALTLETACGTTTKQSMQLQ